MPQGRKKKQAKKFGSVTKRVPEVVNLETPLPGPSGVAEIVNGTEISSSSFSMPEYGENCWADLLDLEITTLEEPFEVGSSSIAVPDLSSLVQQVGLIGRDIQIRTKEIEKWLAKIPDELKTMSVPQALQHVGKMRGMTEEVDKFIADNPDMLFRGMSAQEALEILKNFNRQQQDHQQTAASSASDPGQHQASIKQKPEASAPIPENGVTSGCHSCQDAVDTRSVRDIIDTYGPQKFLDIINEVDAADIPAQHKYEEVRKRLREPYDKGALREKESAAKTAREEDGSNQNIIQNHGARKVFEIIREVQAAGIPEQDQKEEIRKRYENSFDKGALQVEHAAKTAREEDRSDQPVIDTHGPREEDQSDQPVIDIHGPQEEEEEGSAQMPPSAQQIQQMRSAGQTDGAQQVVDTHGLSPDDYKVALETCARMMLSRPALRQNSAPVAEMLMNKVIEITKEVQATAIPQRDQHGEILERLVEPFDDTAQMAEAHAAGIVVEEPATSNGHTEPRKIYLECSDSSEETMNARVCDTWWSILDMQGKERERRITRLYRMPKFMEAADYRKVMNDVMASTAASQPAENLENPSDDVEEAASEDQINPADRPYLPNIWLDHRPNFPKYPRKPFTPIVYESDDVPMLRPIQCFTEAQIKAIKAATAELKKEEEVRKANELKQKNEVQKA